MVTFPLAMKYNGNLRTLKFGQSANVDGEAKFHHREMWSPHKFNMFLSS